MKAVYGPVPSWRLGSSLGLDPICRKEKVCSFGCLYCQLGKTINKTVNRNMFVDEGLVKAEVREIIRVAKPDIITLSGTGEPTLANNLDKIIRNIRETTNLPIAILTNSSLMYRKDVRNDLKLLDVVVVKIDASNAELFKDINQPHKEIIFEKVVSGIKKFRKEFNGKLALQIMFFDKNKEYAAELAELAKELEPEEVQINTPLRPCGVKPLSRTEIEKIEDRFKNFNTVSVYETKRPTVKVINMNETLIRRPEI